MADLDDVRAVAPAVLRHRLVTNFAAEAADRKEEVKLGWCWYWVLAQSPITLRQCTVLWGQAARAISTG